jgi:hypothetical protein
VLCALAGDFDYVPCALIFDLYLKSGSTAKSMQALLIMNTEARAPGRPAQQSTAYIFS